MKKTTISVGSRFGLQRVLHPLLALAPTLLLLAGCGHHEASTTTENAEPPEVEVTYPYKQDLTRRIEQPGQLESYEHTPIYTKIAGFALEPKVDIGDTVEKNQLLLSLYVPEVEEELKVKEARVVRDEADIEQAKAMVKAAEAAVDAAAADVTEKKAGIVHAEADVRRWEHELARAGQMLQRGIYDNQTRDETQKQLEVSRASLDEAKAKHESARSIYRDRQARATKAKADVKVTEAALQFSKAEYNQWKAWLSYAQLRAPFDGIITHRNVHTGHFLQPANSGSTSRTAEPLFTVMRTDIMRIVVQVPERDAVYVKKGDRAVVRPQALAGQEVLGTVTRFSWSVDEHARTLRVEIHVRNPEGTLRPGLYANVSIFAKQPNAMTLPASAILSDILANNNRSYCMVVENGKCHKVFLQLGLRGEEGIQVLAKQAAEGKWEKLKGTEAVVTSHPGSLLEGQVVQLPKKLEAPDTKMGRTALLEEKAKMQTPTKD